MSELIGSGEDGRGKEIDSTKRETSGREDDVEMEQIDRHSNNAQRDEEQWVSQGEHSFNTTQKSNHAFEENQPSKPSMSFIALIAKAILSSASRQLSLSSIYRYIEEHFPYFKTTHRGWRNSVRHNLSLNDCFVKLGRCEDGKGHYWGIHPAHLDDFLRGDYRQHRKANRSRQLRACHNVTEACSWMAQCCSLEYWGSGAAAGGWIPVGYPWMIAYPWNNALVAEWMYYPSSLYYNGLQSSANAGFPPCGVNVYPRCN